MPVLRFPRRFYDDHESRELPTPKPVKQTKQHVWLNTDDPDMPELVSDAEYYADPFGPETPDLRLAAKAFLRVLPEDIRKQLREKAKSLAMFEVEVREVHVQKYHVEALSQEDAIRLVKEGHGWAVDGELSYSHQLDPAGTPVSAPWSAKKIKE